MRRPVLALFLFCAGAAVCPGQETTFYYPQIADGIQDVNYRWRTTVFLTNPGPTATVSGTVTFTRSDGFPFAVSFNDHAGLPVSDGNVIRFNIPPGQTRKYISHAIMPLNTGFATVTASGRISGTAIFSLYRNNGQLVSEAGVPAAAAAMKHAIVVDRTLAGFAGQFDTGVAYANPGNAPATVTLQLFDTDGVAVSAPQIRPLRANGHEALFIGAHLFPAVPSFTGTMTIVSDTPLAVVALRADPSYLLYATLPPVSLASLIRPAWDWLERPWFTALNSLVRAALRRPAWRIEAQGGGA